MKCVYIDCELTGGIGNRRIVTKSTDGLYDLRQACRNALNATPKQEWTEGKTADEIVSELVRLCLNPKPPITAEVFSYTMGRSSIEVILRMPRATALNLTKESIDILASSQGVEWHVK